MSKPAATPRTPTVRYDTPPGCCRWCREPIDKEKHPRAKTWHPACVEEYWSQQPTVLRRRVHERDGGVCAACGCRVEDRAARARGQAYWRAILRLPGIPARASWGWSEASRARRTMPLQQDLPGLGRWEPGRSEWQMDHVVPLWEGGENALANLQTLCTPCHKAKTRAEAARRARARRPLAMQAPETPA